MKLDLLKKLIKEAVKEAVREELETILSEDVKPKSTPVGVGGYGTPNTVKKYAEYKPVVSKPVSTGDPLMDLLNETQASMMGAANHSNIDVSSYVSAPGLGMNPVMMENNFAMPEPGLDISQFDFIKNAGAVYKASVEKDKARFGA